MRLTIPWDSCTMRASEKREQNWRKEGESKIVERESGKVLDAMSFVFGPSTNHMAWNKPFHLSQLPP